MPHLLDKQNRFTLEALPFDVLLIILKIVASFPSRIVPRNWCSHHPTLPHEIWNLSLVSKTIRDAVVVLLLDTVAFVVQDQSENSRSWATLEKRLDDMLESDVLRQTTKYFRLKSTYHRRGLIWQNGPSPSFFFKIPLLLASFNNLYEIDCSLQLDWVEESLEPGFEKASLPTAQRPRSPYSSFHAIGAASLLLIPYTPSSLQFENCLQEFKSVRRLLISRSCQFLIRYCPFLEFLQDNGVMHGSQGPEAEMPLDLSMLGENSSLEELFVKDMMTESLVSDIVTYAPKLQRLTFHWDDLDKPFTIDQDGVFGILPLLSPLPNLSVLELPHSMNLNVRVDPIVHGHTSPRQFWRSLTLQQLLVSLRVLNAIDKVDTFLSLSQVKIRPTWFVRTRLNTEESSVWGEWDGK